MDLNGSKATSAEFTPGSGLIPPYLAGRGHEQGRLTRQYQIVAAGGWLVLDYVTGHIGSFLTQI